MRSLQGFTPDLLIEEAQDGQDLAAALENARSESFVTCSSLGPKTDEQEAMQIVPAGQRRHCASDHRVCITPELGENDGPSGAAAIARALALERGIPVVAVGDGGNEIGMGKSRIT